MAKIRKRMGIPQEFNGDKLQQSIERAGVPTTVAKQIVDKFQPKEDMSTEEIRKIIANRLSEINQVYAASYQSIRKLNVRCSAYVGRGVCRINEDFMNRIGLSSGKNVMLIAGDSKLDLKAEGVTSLSSREILINDYDLNRLNTPSGTRIEIKLQNE